MVTFFLVNPERDISSISILVSMRGKKYRRTIGESTPVKLWSKAKKRVKVSADNTSSNLINDVISKWEAAALRTVSYFKDRSIPPDAPEFFSRLDSEYYAKNESDESPLFLTYIKTYTSRYSKVRDTNTLKKYQTAYNKLLAFEKETKKKLRFEDININFYNDFQFWFYNKAHSDNYFGTIIKFVKQVFREARVVDKLHNYDSTGHKDFITTSRESQSVYLNEEELLRIHSLDLSEDLIREHYPSLSPFRILQKIESLQLVRVRFLVGAYTGLRVSDFGRLKEMNLDGKYIRIKTAKTGTATVIPIHPVLRELFDRGFDLDCTISEQKINTHIKELAKMAGITQPVLINKNIAGKVEEAVYEKYKLISSHTARRSFATNAYKADIPTIAIMKITGHRKESTFLKYIKVSAEENAEMLLSHPFFRDKSVAEPSAEPFLPDEKENIT